MKLLSLHFLIIQKLLFIKLCLCITKPLDLNGTNNNSNTNQNQNQNINDNSINVSSNILLSNNIIPNNSNTNINLNSINNSNNITFDITNDPSHLNINNLNNNYNINNLNNNNNSGSSNDNSHNYNNINSNDNSNINSNNNDNLLSTEQEIVDGLVRQWSPLVWLAPGEKFMPSSTTAFLKNVHAERAKKSTNTIHDISEITDLNKYAYYYYYNDENELTYYDPIVNNRNKRNYKDKNVILSAFDMPMDENSEEWFLVTNSNVDDLMSDKKSFLYGQNPNADTVPIYAVVNMCSSGTVISSYSPAAAAPLLNAAHDIENNDVVYNTMEKVEYKKNPYIPLTKSLHLLPLETPTSAPSLSSSLPPQSTLALTATSVGLSVPVLSPLPSPAMLFKPAASMSLISKVYQNPDMNSMIAIEEGQKIVHSIRRRRRRAANGAPEGESKDEDSDNVIQNSAGGNVEEYRNADGEKEVNTVEAEWDRIIVNKDDDNEIISINLQDKLYNVNDNVKSQLKKKDSSIPHFHVTYWMFYPYNRGKTICTLNLGPLGPLPIPLIFGMCLGTKKEYGSHVGDWEHMSLFFRGKSEPEEMYVSAHDAGAYYSYDRLTGTFEFRSQETRKGILQRPSFPRTVITSSNHPVLFAAEGSHGLWTAPGKHRFVRVPRLYDVNGFGTPWSTWRNVQIIYDNNLRGQRSLNPNWMRFRGRWGNPKSKCHPLKKIGLHFCEYSDGPTGIPRKQHNFYCKSK